MPTYRLITEIIARSEAKTWDLAKLEWSLNVIVYAERDAPETCLCSHFPIIEICLLRNGINGNQVQVGNCCVKKFIGLLHPDKIIQSFKRIRRDISKSLNDEALQYALARHWFCQTEYDFYFDIKRKRRLSKRQRAWKIKLNRLFIRNIPQTRPKLI